MDMVNVDFEWFDPNPEVDFHGLKTLLRQLLDADHHLFDLSALADLILSQPLLGSTVKVDGKESDPFAFLTVLNLETHKVRLTPHHFPSFSLNNILQSNPAIQQLTHYISEKTAQPTLAPLHALLNQTNPQPQVGLILTERFINMPHEIVPPMYTMLLEELQWAIEANEPYSFTHYLLLSKTYVEIESQLPSSSAPPSKKKKGPKGGDEQETFYFHPEDEVWARYALCAGGFDYSTKEDEGKSDSKRAFQELGVKPKGHLVLVEAAKFHEAVKAAKGFLGGEQ